jgi:hypothetical protein
VQGRLEDADEGQAGEDTAGVREEVAPAAGATRAKELANFQGHGCAKAAAAEALQGGNS